ncbi:MAG TPA: CHRD domain-containing protein [Planctomycetota bacterium]|nr:CHRD domain-containing protein [Planctomycetota bacterium]
MTSRLRSIASALALAALASTSASQDLYAARLSGANAVPATASPATGRGWFDFDLPSLTLRCRVETDANAIGVAIHRAAAGANGPSVLTLTHVAPMEWEGAISPLGVTDVDALWSGELYVAVYTAASPPSTSGGAIRDQLARSQARPLLGILDGFHVVPLVSSPAHGLAVARLRLPEGVMTYDVSATGLLTPAIGANVHLGGPGVNGPIVFALALEGSPLAPTVKWSGTSPPLSPTAIDAILGGGAYVSIDSALFPGGELRAQLQLQIEDFVALVAESMFGIPGFGVFRFDPFTDALTYDAEWPSTGSHGADVRKLSPADLTGPITFVLQGPMDGPWSGTSPALGPAQIDHLHAGLECFVIEVAAIPVLRGQLRPNPSIFGWPGPTSDGPLGRVMRIGSHGSASLGNTLVVTLHGAQPGAVVALGIGVAGGVPTPFDLDVVGATSQVLWVSPDIGLSTVAGPTGSAEIAIPIPSIAAYEFAPIPFQWVGIEPGANPLGVVVSDAMRVVLVP